MPISYGLNEKQFKIGSIALNRDGTMIVNGQFGYIENGIFQVYIDKSFNISKEDSDSILDLPAQEGMSRRQDFSSSIYKYLTDNNIIEQGLLV